jgi:hypothetical protein
MTECSFLFGAPVTGAQIIPILHADDSDYYIESAEFSLMSVVAIDGSNSFSWTLATYNNAGVDQSKNLQSAPPAPTSLTALAYNDLAVNQNQLLADGNVLMLKIADAVGSGANVVGVAIRVRYRRKA